MLIIGATGDIGSACTRYFASKAKKLMLCARQLGPLEKLASSLRKENNEVEFSTNINSLLPAADIVICVASSFLEKCDLSLLPVHAIICDAGYPKNIQHNINHFGRHIFSGGMGIVREGFSFSPDFTDHIYRFPVENTAHGCILESIVLAMGNDPKALSVGRGNITVNAIDEMLALAESHGVCPAPLFSSEGLWEPAKQIQQHERA